MTKREIAGREARSRRFRTAAVGFLLLAAAASPALAYSNGNLPESDLGEIYRPGGNCQLQKDAAAAWNAMRAFLLQKGVDIYPKGPNSAYRTYSQQVSMKHIYGSNAARPGTSNHGLGLAVDVATMEMRRAIDKYGAQFGWSKKWSDAPWEWWHIKYRPGVWHGQGRVADRAAAPAASSRGGTDPADAQGGQGFTQALHGLGTSEGAHGVPAGSGGTVAPGATAAPAQAVAASPDASPDASSAPAASGPLASRVPMNQPLGEPAPGDSGAGAGEPAGAQDSGAPGPSSQATSAPPTASPIVAAPAPSAPAPSAPSPATAPTLKRGDRGPAVVALQTFFARLGYTISVNGVFDGQTERVVRAYQHANRIPADGVVRERLWQEISADVARRHR